MKKLTVFALLAFASGALMAADAKEEVNAALKKLADKKNFSWSSEVKNEGGDQSGGGAGGGRRGFGGGPSSGKLSEDTTHITMGQMEIVYKGEKGAIKTQNGWMSTEELGNQGGGQGGGFGRFAGTMRSNSIPTKQIEETLTKVKELKKESDGSYSGELPEDAVKDLLNPMARFARNNPNANANAPTTTVTGAKGSVKFWVKDGVLTKYENKVEGKVSGTFRDQAFDREVNRTTTTEFKDIGSTKVELPEEAKQKLS